MGRGSWQASGRQEPGVCLAPLAQAVGARPAGSCSILEKCLNYLLAGDQRPLRSILLALRPDCLHPPLPTGLPTSSSGRSSRGGSSVLPTTPFVEETAQGPRRRGTTPLAPAFLSPWPYLPPVEVRAVLSLFRKPQSHLAKAHRRPLQFTFIRVVVGEDGSVDPTPSSSVSQTGRLLRINVHTLRQGPSAQICAP